MSHFYGTVQGNRGLSSRGGSKDSGICTHTASWQGAVRVHMFYNPKLEKDIAFVELTPWNGKGTPKILYCGPVCGE